MDSQPLDTPFTDAEILRQRVAQDLQDKEYKAKMSKSAKLIKKLLASNEVKPSTKMAYKLAYALYYGVFDGYVPSSIVFLLSIGRLETLLTGWDEN